jgi:hypothetical protein
MTSPNRSLRFEKCCGSLGAGRGLREFQTRAEGQPIRVLE